jgi:upstream activation factor subunit UAF30
MSVRAWFKAVDELSNPFPEEYMPTKTTDGKAAAKKPAAKKAAGSKPNALQQPLQPSKELAAIVGSNPLPRGEVVSKMWEYIKKNNLQNPENKREILADDKLQPIFGKPKVTMFEMNKHLAQHLK